MTRYLPLWQQEGVYSATFDRQLIQTMWQAGGSTLPVNVTQSATAMTATISPGAVVVPMPTGQGSELCWWDAPETVTFAAAPGAGTSRYDLIIAQVRDDNIDASGQNNFTFTTVTGTAAASPTVPATPAQAFSLGQMLIPASVTNLSTATWIYTAPLIAPMSSIAGMLVGASTAVTTVAAPAGMYMYPLNGGYTTGGMTLYGKGTDPGSGQGVAYQGLQVPRTGMYRVNATTATARLNAMGTQYRAQIWRKLPAYSPDNSAQGREEIRNQTQPTSGASDPIYLNVGGLVACNDNDCIALCAWWANTANTMTQIAGGTPATSGFLQVEYVGPLPSGVTPVAI